MEIVITMPTGNVYQYFRAEEKKNQNQVPNDCTEFRTFSNQEDWTPDYVVVDIIWPRIGRSSLCFGVRLF